MLEVVHVFKDVVVEVTCRLQVIMEVDRVIYHRESLRFELQTRTKARKMW